MDMKCQRCGEELELDDSLSGQLIKCPTCAHKFLVPALRASSTLGITHSKRPRWIILVGAGLLVVGILICAQLIKTSSLPLLAQPESIPIKTIADPEPSKPEPPPQVQPEPTGDPDYKFNFFFLPSLPKGEAASLMDVPAYHYNEVWKMMNDRTLSVTFSDEKFCVYVDGNGFILTPIEAPQFVSMMEKYREWRKKALAMGTTVQKDIGSVSVEIFWKTYDDEWHFGSRTVAATCAFFSQNTQRHQMTMRFEKVSSTKNEYLDYRLDTIYFDPEGVDNFLAALSRPNINAKVEAHRNKKQIESQFQ